MTSDPIEERIEWASNRAKRIVDRFIEMRNAPLSECDLFEVRAHSIKSDGFGLYLSEESSALTEISLRFADCVHQLRCALDHLAFQYLDAAAPQDVKRNQLAFPSSMTRKGKTLDLFQEYAPSKAQAITELFAEKNVYSSRLKLLCKADNYAKHRALIQVIGSFIAPYFAHVSAKNLYFTNEPKEGAFLSSQDPNFLEEAKSTIAGFFDFYLSQDLIEDEEHRNIPGRELLQLWATMVRDINARWNSVD